VTYLSYGAEHEQYREAEPAARACSRLALAETALGANEIDGTIVGGDDPTCGVGARVRVVARLDGELTVSTDPPVAPRTGDLLRELHEHLRHPRSGWSLGRTMRWDAPTKRVVERGVEYLDTVLASSEEVHGMSDRDRQTSLHVRERAADHALVCETYEDDTEGAGEYGGFSYRAVTRLAVDYGDGASRCPD